MGRERAAGRDETPRGTCSVGPTHTHRVAGRCFRPISISGSRVCSEPSRVGEMLSLVPKGGQANRGWADCSLPARVLEAKFRSDCAGQDQEGACEKLA